MTEPSRMQETGGLCPPPPRAQEGKQEWSDTPLPPETASSEWSKQSVPHTVCVVFSGVFIFFLCILPFSSTGTQSASLTPFSSPPFCSHNNPVGEVRLGVGLAQGHPGSFPGTCCVRSGTRLSQKRVQHFHHCATLAWNSD